MKIYFDNVSFNSPRGKDSFARHLWGVLKASNEKVEDVKDADIHMAFIKSMVKNPGIPLVLRLDGIYFHSKMDNKAINIDLERTYKEASAVIIQSEFDKKIITNFFGDRPNREVIHNGTDVEFINMIKPMENPFFDKFETVWSCASRWHKPHKRLKENVRYFLEHSSPKDCLAIAGQTHQKISNDRIICLGDLKWKKLISLYRRSKHFVHLALVDHCPNVVVDAKGAGCQIICASMAGTEEVAGLNATVIEDMEWDYKTPFDYTKPPKLDFSKKRNGKFDISVDIKDVARQYLNVFNSVL